MGVSSDVVRQQESIPVKLSSTTCPFARQPANRAICGQYINSFQYTAGLSTKFHMSNDGKDPQNAHSLYTNIQSNYEGRYTVYKVS